MSEDINDLVALSIQAFRDSEKDRENKRVAEEQSRKERLAYRYEERTAYASEKTKEVLGIDIDPDVWEQQYGSVKLETQLDMEVNITLVIDLHTGELYIKSFDYLGDRSDISIGGLATFGGVIANTVERKDREKEIEDAIRKAEETGVVDDCIADTIHDPRLLKNWKSSLL